MEAKAMRHDWSKDEIQFERMVLDVEDRCCRVCSGIMHACDHRTRHLYTLDGGLLLVNRLRHCADKRCSGRHVTVSPEAEMSIAMPGWAIAWDVFCWVGHRRFSRHWSVPQIRQELSDTYEIRLSDDAIEDYLDRYQAMVAARQQDHKELSAAYEGVRSVLLTIDGLQPEKGHETLYTVREIRRRRVWFAESLISSGQEEVHRLIVRAKEMARSLGKSVAGWGSDKQEAFVKAIAAEFPGVPHRYCRNHFLRDLAKPTLEKDRHAKVQMRKKVRGLRAIEKEVLMEQAPKQTPGAAGEERSPPPSRSDGKVQDDDATCAGQVVLDYCSATRAILNDDQGGPLSPPGLRMAEGLREVGQSLRRSAETKKRGPHHGSSSGSRHSSTPASRSSTKIRRRSDRT
jgi:hypothetical protein